jgi:hypothetical protein
MGTSASGFEWKPNLACGSCYKILGELHQFDAARVPFDKAAALTMDKLNFWPLSSNTSDIREISAQLLTQSYIPLLARNFVLRPQNNSKWKDVRRAMQAVLVDESKTVSDLAEAIDNLIQFEDE